MEMLEFAKGHGTGNDFVIIPDPDGAVALTPALVRALCDRRRGIGGDGVLRAIRAAAHPEAAGAAGDAEWFMDYHNADGSVAEMCGNGVRVFARFLVESGLAPAGRLTLATRTGPVVATVAGGAVTAALGVPRVTGRSWARVGGRRFDGMAVDCGNPHLVCTVPDDAALAAADLSAPPEVEPGAFPAGVNVELVTTVPAAPGSPAGEVRVRMRVYERGVGETLSCGSGACAAAVVALRGAGLDFGTVVVEVPGGRLSARLTDRACELTGPAVVVASGTVRLDRLAGAAPAAPPPR